VAQITLAQLTADLTQARNADRAAAAQAQAAYKASIQAMVDNAMRAFDAARSRK
jgi:hypothetical protein